MKSLLLLILLFPPSPFIAFAKQATCEFKIRGNKHKLELRISTELKEKTLKWWKNQLETKSKIYRKVKNIANRTSFTLGTMIAEGNTLSPDIETENGFNIYEALFVISLKNRKFVEKYLNNHLKGEIYIHKFSYLDENGCSTENSDKMSGRYLPKSDICSKGKDRLLLKTNLPQINLYSTFLHEAKHFITDRYSKKYRKFYKLQNLRSLFYNETQKGNKVYLQSKLSRYIDYNGIYEKYKNIGSKISNLLRKMKIIKDSGASDYNSQEALLKLTEKLAFEIDDETRVLVAYNELVSYRTEALFQKEFIKMCKKAEFFLPESQLNESTFKEKMTYEYGLAQEFVDKAITEAKKIY